MTLIELPDLVQGTDAWLEQRRGMVTASVVGKLVSTRTKTAIEFDCAECTAWPGDLCVSKRSGERIKTLHPARTDAARNDSTPPQLVAADNDDSRGLTALLVAERITGHIDPVFVNDDMLRGQLDEPLARDKYAEHYGVKVRTTGFMVREEDAWRLGYSPDGLVGEDGLIEVKAPRAKTHLRTILADEMPAAHMPQVQAGLLVTGREWLDFISYSGGMPMFTKRVLPDQRWFDAIQAAAEKFETTAAEMLAAYEAAVVGLPKTERMELNPDIKFDIEMNEAA